MVSQLTLSLYLITLCQLKLRHSVTSVAQTLDYTKVAHRKLGVRWTLERLILKMTAQKAPDLGVLETESWSRDPFYKSCSRSWSWNLRVKWTLERLILKMTAQKAPDLEFSRLESWSRDPFLQVLVSVLVLEPQSQVDLRTTDAEDDCTEGSDLHNNDDERSDNSVTVE